MTTTRTKALTILLLATSTIQVATARPMDAIGACPLSGKMTLATGEFKGNAQVMKGAANFLKQHTSATIQEDAWLKLLSGGSGKNRVYERAGQKVIIATLCNPKMCEDNRAYIAFEPATGAYGGSIYEGRPMRSIGLLPGPTPSMPWYPDQLDAPIVCAQNLDWGLK